MKEFIMTLSDQTLPFYAKVVVIMDLWHEDEEEPNGKLKEWQGTGATHSLQCQKAHPTGEFVVVP